MATAAIILVLLATCPAIAGGVKGYSAEDAAAIKCNPQITPEEKIALLAGWTSGFNFTGANASLGEVLEFAREWCTQHPNSS